MRTSPSLLALLLLVGLAGCASSRYDGRRAYPEYARVSSSGGNATYAVCHHGRNTLTLPQPAVDAHMRHGDYFGACGRDNRNRHDTYYRGRNDEQRRDDHHDNGRGRGNRGQGRGN